eukprot:TRINITY_DN1111_c0_g1_i1.p1 TRINITY_DN1111_c0_g1~~TRINITY_DN1111_c0_g1_i1.p1  ORF type:complete len:313 (+),score=149.69 TRINITY_DN1111_c0_g1_i1:62-940(+)
MQMRALVLLSAAAVAVANQMCVNSIIQTTADVAMAIEEVNVVVKACKNSTEAVCLENVRGLSSSITTLAQQTGNTLTACNDVGAQCTGDINAAAADLNTVLDKVTRAVLDCGKAGNKMDCTVDVLDASAAMGHVAKDIFLATGSCSKSVPALRSSRNLKDTQGCVQDLTIIVGALSSSVTSIQAAIAACKEGACGGDIAHATATVALLVEASAKALATCGAVSESQCAIDIQSAAVYLTKASTFIQKSVQYCGEGAQHDGYSCADTLIDTSAAVGHSVVRIVKSTKECSKKL